MTDCVENIFEVFKDIFVLKPDNSYVKSLQELGSLLVSLRSCACHVRVTIQFDGEPIFRTIKVDNVRTYSVLPPKFLPIEPGILEVCPEQSLGAC